MRTRGRVRYWFPETGLGGILTNAGDVYLLRAANISAGIPRQGAAVEFTPSMADLKDGGILPDALEVVCL